MRNIDEIIEINAKDFYPIYKANQNGTQMSPLGDTELTDFLSNSTAATNRHQKLELATRDIVILELAHILLNSTCTN